MYHELQQIWSELTAPGGPFEVATATVRGVEIKVYANAPANVREVWLASRAHGDNDYLVYGDDRWTYAQAHRDVDALAGWLTDQGVGPGDRVAIAMRNYPEWLLAYWATVSIGAVSVGMNAWWVGAEMVYGLEDARPKVLIADQERLDRLAEHPEAVADLTVVGVRLDARPESVIPWSQVVAGDGVLPEVQIDPDADACIFYTSGTTGHPKGAALTHRGCVHNLMSLMFWGTVNSTLAVRRGLVDPDAPAPTPASLVTTPLFHVTANNCVAYGATAGGGKLVLMYRWDPGEALRLIERERITGMSGVPVMSRELISHPDFARTDTSSLVSVGGGGAALQPDLVSKIDESVATARPGTGYGMTETCGIITSISGDFYRDRPDSAGPAMPVYDVKVVDAAGNTLPQGEAGELWVKGAHVIRGYLNRPEATAETITDGWLHTGDIARLDADGFIYIVDRVKDMVLRGGENVYCAEVEAALHEDPDVAEAVVFGVPDQRLGEEVAAAVRLTPGIARSTDELRGHLAQRIARHKIPRYIWLETEPLPKNANGKYLKRELRERLDVANAS